VGTFVNNPSSTAFVRAIGGGAHGNVMSLRGLLLFEEVSVFLPPHLPPTSASPPTKGPLVELMKQARGFGVGFGVATQRRRGDDCVNLG
jgi:hypothetical protein